jgi:hypothetical protein
MPSDHSEKRGPDRQRSVERGGCTDACRLRGQSPFSRQETGGPLALLPSKYGCMHGRARTNVNQARAHLDQQTNPSFCLPILRTNAAAVRRSLNTRGGRRCSGLLKIRPNLESPADGLRPSLPAYAPRPRSSAKLAGGKRDSCVCRELLLVSQDSDQRRACAA